MRQTPYEIDLIQETQSHPIQSRGPSLFSQSEIVTLPHLPSQCAYIVSECSLRRSDKKLPTA